MGKASHQCTGSRSRERHQENLRVFLVVCFKCGTFSLTKEKMSFLAIFGRYHTLFLGFLAKKVFYLKIFSKSSSIKGWFVLWKRGDFWGGFLKRFSDKPLRIFLKNFWEKGIFFLWRSSWKILETLFENFSLDLLKKVFLFGKSFFLELFEWVFFFRKISCKTLMESF